MREVRICVAISAMYICVEEHAHTQMHTDTNTLCMHCSLPYVKLSSTKSASLMYRMFLSMYEYLYVLYVLIYVCMHL
jgi:hypothetical protein